MGQLASLLLRRISVVLVAQLPVALVLLLGSGDAQARSMGIDSSMFGASGCNQCHNSPGAAVAPLLMLTTNDNTVVAGQQIVLTLVVTRQSSTQTAAGFNLRASAPGSFILGGSGTVGTKLTGPGGTGDVEATHSAPKPVVGESTTFTVLWTPAAATSGTVTFTAWGNSVNLSLNNSGDIAASTTLAVTVFACASPTTWYADADADGFGTAASITVACTMPAGHAATATDCNDANAAIKPGAAEVCNGVDDNCTGGVDDGLTTTTFYRDLDADTFGAATSGTKSSCSLAQAGAGYVANASDCNDASATIKPGATESCNGVDDNCSGAADENLGTLTCGTGACVTLVAACMGGVSQTCTPMCPDAGADAADAADASDASDAVTDVVADTTPPVDLRPDTTPTVDMRPADTTPTVDMRPADTTPAMDVRPDAVVDAGVTDVRPADVRPADASDGRRDTAASTDGDGCDCRMGGANHARDGLGATACAAFVLLALVRRRRRR